MGIVARYGGVICIMWCVILELQQAAKQPCNQILFLFLKQISFLQI